MYIHVQLWCACFFSDIHLRIGVLDHEIDKAIDIVYSLHRHVGDRYCHCFPKPTRLFELPTADRGLWCSQEHSHLLSVTIFIFATVGGVLQYLLYGTIVRVSSHIRLSTFAGIYCLFNCHFSLLPSFPCVVCHFV